MIALTDEEAGELDDGQELLIEERTTSGREFTDTLVVGSKGMHLVATPHKGFVELVQETGAKFYTAQHSIFGAGGGSDPLMQFLERGLNSGEGTPHTENDVP